MKYHNIGIRTTIKKQYAKFQPFVCIRNAWVAGSSPAGGSKGFRNLHIKELRKT